MRHRRWLLSISIGIHVALLSVFVIKGVWSIERLDAGRMPGPSLAVMQPFENAGGSAPAAGKKPPDPRAQVRHKAPTLVQPTPHVPDQVATAPAGGNGEGPGDHPGPGLGDGSGQALDGACAIPPCGEPPPAPPPAPPPGPARLAPTVLAGLRIAGDTQIQPSDATKNLIHRDGKSRVSSTFKVCIADSGAIQSANLLRSSGYDEYDHALAAAIGTWRYRPYTLDGRAIPACSAVTFVFALE